VAVGKKKEVGTRTVIRSKTARGKDPCKIRAATARNQLTVLKRRPTEEPERTRECGMREDLGQFNTGNGLDDREKGGKES